METKLTKLLMLLDEMGINQVTLEPRNFDEEYELSSDDKDYVTFHKGSEAPWITDKLMVCDVETTQKPVWKDWYMSINYHS